VKELFKFQNTESKIQPNHGPSPMVVPPRYLSFLLISEWTRGKQRSDPSEQYLYPVSDSDA
jgi:hypothetical protein